LTEISARADDRAILDERVDNRRVADKAITSNPAASMPIVL